MMGALYEDVEKFFGDIFAQYGRFLAKHPVAFMILSLVVSLLLGMGLINVRYENNVETLYTPRGSPAFTNRAQLSQLFPDTTKESYYPHQLIYHSTYGELLFLPKDGDNILETKYITEIKKLFDELVKMTLDENNRGLHYRDLCAVRNSECVIDGESVLDALVENGCINYTDEFPLFKENTGLILDLRDILSGIHDRTDHSPWKEERCLKAKVLRLRFNLRHDTEQQRGLSLHWELRFLDTISNYHIHDVEIFYAASESLDIELAAHLGQDTKFFSLTIMIMVLYAVFVSSGGNWVSTRVLLALAGILASLLAILASFGLLSMCGMQFVDICGVMPFLILGVGVDDMFILMSGWRQTDLTLSIEDRMADTFRSSAISVTITSLTDMLAFFIGATSPFLSVRSFCIYAGVAVLFCYVNHLTFFSGCMVLHARRVLASRHCVTCLPTRSKKTLKEAGVSRRKVLCCHGQPPRKIGDDNSLCEKIPNTVLPRILLQWPVKITVILLFFVYFGVSIWGALNIKTGLKIENVVPDSSYLSMYYETKKEYFLSHGPPIMFVITSPVDYEEKEIQQKIHYILKEAKGCEYIDDEFQISWLDQYTHSYSRADHEDFVIDVKNNFLSLYPDYKNDIKFNGAGDVIEASRFYVRSKRLDNSTAEGNLMIKIRQIASNTSFPILAYSPEFIYYEHYVSILKDTLLSVGIAVIGMIFITLMFIPHPVSITLVIISMVTIVLGMFGFMSFWDLELSAITNVQIILSVGFCVDYTVHISHAFMSSTGMNRNERVRIALERVGIPILNGAFSSVLGVLVLAFAHSYVFRAFFKTMVLVISLGITHSLILLPVVLSFIGPRRTSKPRVFIPMSASWESHPILGSFFAKHRAQLEANAEKKEKETVELMKIETPDEKKSLLPSLPKLLKKKVLSVDLKPTRSLIDRTPEEEHYRLPLAMANIHLQITAPDPHESHFTSVYRNQNNVANEGRNFASFNRNMHPGPPGLYNPDTRPPLPSPPLEEVPPHGIRGSMLYDNPVQGATITEESMEEQWQLSNGGAVVSKKITRRPSSFDLYDNVDESDSIMESTVYEMVP